MSEYQKIKKNSLEFVSEKNNKFLNIYLGLAQLKNTLRTGWMKYHGLKDQSQGESVADHSFTSATLAYIISKELKLDLDHDKVLMMMLFHEIGEIKIGDKVSYKNRDISNDEKSELEKTGIEEVFSELNIKKELLEMWEEQEIGNSKEALFVQSMDQLEAVFQAWLYQKNNLVGDSVKEFKVYAEKVARENKCESILEILKSISLEKK